MPTDKERLDFLEWQARDEPDEPIVQEVER